ncbi:hypothetical protein F2Q69_00014295 [Brassica cretica]|uniref:Uncharacterized protein n=1 Tax=Brassica cretica TaxID=69181 RepID=A0A8S9R8X9_BRACR|nr:hypothetical protein F2Q69_00014295 [Brassica cretica]
MNHKCPLRPSHLADSNRWIIFFAAVCTYLCPSSAVLPGTLCHESAVMLSPRLWSAWAPSQARISANPLCESAASLLSTAAKLGPCRQPVGLQLLSGAVLCCTPASSLSSSSSASHRRAPSSEPPRFDLLQAPLFSKSRVILLHVVLSFIAAVMSPSNRDSPLGFRSGEKKS